MTTTYTQALSSLKSVADQLAILPQRMPEDVPLGSAVGRIAARDYISPITTPPFDSSAMDGFAVVAATTQTASQNSPITFRIAACVVAGDPLMTMTSSRHEDGLAPCIEIMTGSRFPSVLEHEEDFDAVIKMEDTAVLNMATPHGTFRCISITKPIARHAHKRLAGSDFQPGELVARSQETIRPHHVMALASLGVQKLAVMQKPKVGLWSTGMELVAGQTDSTLSSHINDTNGPFIEASLREFGANVDFLGVIDDNELSFKKSLRRKLQTSHFDVLITTGAVSRGKFDFVPHCIEAMGGVTMFHGVSMRPGHPVLFATLPSLPTDGDTQQTPEDLYCAKPALQGTTPFFGLPGNPIAAAACLRFLVLPFLRYSFGREGAEVPVKAKLRKADGSGFKQHEHLDNFLHGHLSTDEATGWAILPSTDQSPAKMKPFSRANCWCHIARGRSSLANIDTVDCFPL